LIFYFHDGGVTKRHPEILELLNGTDFRLFSDFIPPSSIAKKEGFLRKVTASGTLALKVFLKITGFLSSVNNDEEYKRLKPWVYSIRGHYSHRNQSDLAVREVLSRMLALKVPDFNSAEIAVHYRLGDLTDLATKQPIPPAQIKSEISRIMTVPRVVVVYSDSVDRAADLLNFPGCDVKTGDGNSIQTVLQLMNSKLFIGTSSKISYWATIFRVSSNSPSDSSLPLSDKNQIELNLRNKSLTTVYYY